MVEGWWWCEWQGMPLGGGLGGGGGERGPKASSPPSISAPAFGIIRLSLSLSPLVVRFTAVSFLAGGAHKQLVATPAVLGSPQWRGKKKKKAIQIPRGTREWYKWKDQMDSHSCRPRSKTKFPSGAFGLNGHARLKPGDLWQLGAAVGKAGGVEYPDQRGEAPVDSTIGNRGNRKPGPLYAIVPVYSTIAGRQCH